MERAKNERGVARRGAAMERSALAALVAGACGLAFGVACGSSQTTATGGGGDGGVVTVVDSGVVATDCGDSPATLSGTWDVVATSDPFANAATITIDASTFRFASGAETLAFSVAGSAMQLTWTDGARSTPITTTRDTSSASLNGGVIPLALGGAWTFASTTDTEGCTAQVGSAAFSATCNDVRGTPFGRLAGTLAGTRTAPATSVFGDLGGTWHLTPSGGAIDVTIVGNEFSAVATHPGFATGSIDVKVCSGTASGKTGDGYEFTARKQ